MVALVVWRERQSAQQVVWTMRLSQNTIDLAAKLVAEGYAKFIGDGATIEIGQRMPYRLLFRTIGKDVEPIVLQWGDFDNSKWKRLQTIKPPTAEMEKTILLVDSALASVKRAGSAGSKARVDALQAHYAAARLDPSGERLSPFGVDLAALWVEWVLRKQHNTTYSVSSNPAEMDDMTE